MPAPPPRMDNPRRVRLTGLGTGLTLLLLAAVACGGDTGAPDTPEPTSTTMQAPSDEPDAGVAPSDRTYTFDDFRAAGIKHGKDYDVEGLPGAVAAVLAFHDRKDVEIRFFPSHDVAVVEGIPVAEEIVGPDVFIKYGEVTWPDAIPDERACAPGNLGGGRDCTRQPKYGGFVVHGNFIMFCEGEDSEAALERCNTILERLGAPSR